MKENKCNFQIFLLPFAGGLSTSFEDLVNLIPSQIDSYVVEYPGHGKRYLESFCNSFEELLDDVVEQINRNIDIDKDIALFGYSLGTLIAFEIIRRNKLIKQPVIFFAAAQSEPQINMLPENVMDWNIDDVVNYTIKLGGVDKRLLTNRRILEALLIPTKHDYNIRNNYKFKDTYPNIDCDIIVIYSKDDTPRDSMNGWKSVTNKKTIFEEFEGNHFFIYKNTSNIADIIKNNLQ